MFGPKTIGSCAFWLKYLDGLVVDLLTPLLPALLQVRDLRFKLDPETKKLDIVHDSPAS